LRGPPFGQQHFFVQTRALISDATKSARTHFEEHFSGVGDVLRISDNFVISDTPDRFWQEATALDGAIVQSNSGLVRAWTGTSGSALNVSGHEVLNFPYILEHGHPHRTSPSKQTHAATHEELLRIYDTMKGRLLSVGAGIHEKETLQIFDTLFGEDQHSITVVKNLATKFAAKVWSGVEQQIRPLYGVAGRIRQNPSVYEAAPTTNLQAESAAGWVGVALRTCSSVLTVSKKRVIVCNGYFDSVEWKRYTTEEKRQRLLSTRTLPTFVKAREELAQYQEILRDLKVQALKKKAEARLINQKKLAELSAVCLAWGGPVTKAEEVDGLTVLQSAQELKVKRKQFQGKGEIFSRKNWRSTGVN
jgi:hypothetical protein